MSTLCDGQLEIPIERGHHEKLRESHSFTARMIMKSVIAVFILVAIEGALFLKNLKYVIDPPINQLSIAYHK